MKINSTSLPSHISHEYEGGERIENLMILFPDLLAMSAEKDFIENNTSIYPIYRILSVRWRSHSCLSCKYICCLKKQVATETSQLKEVNPYIKANCLTDWMEKDWRLNSVYMSIAHLLNPASKQSKINYQIVWELGVCVEVACSTF